VLLLLRRVLEAAADAAADYAAHPADAAGEHPCEAAVEHPHRHEGDDEGQWNYHWDVLLGEYAEAYARQQPDHGRDRDACPSKELLQDPHLATSFQALMTTLLRRISRLNVRVVKITTSCPIPSTKQPPPSMQHPRIPPRSRTLQATSTAIEGTMMAIPTNWP